MGLKLAEAFVKIGFDTTVFDKKLAKAKKSFSKGLADMEQTAKKARLGVAVAAGALGLVVKTAATFEQSMARVKAISGATGGEFAALAQKARDLGKSTAFTADNAAEAMGNFALAGFDTKEMLDAITPTLNLAAAGQLDMATSASIVSKTMRGMQIDTSKTGEVIDVLTKAFTTSNTDVIQLGEAFKFVGPVGAAAGKDLGELTAAIQLMSNAGVQGGMAGSSLRNILIRLQAQPTEVKKAMQAMGVSVETSGGKMRHLADIIDDMNTAMESMTQIQRSSTVAQVGGLRAIAGLTVLLEQGGDEMRKFEHRLSDAGGTAAKIAAVQLDTLTGEFQKLKSAIGEMFIMLGSELAPEIRQIVKTLTKWVNGTGELNTGLSKTIMTVAAFAVKVGAVVVAIGLAVTALKMMGGAMMALSNPYTLAIAAVVALAAVWVDATIKGQAFSESLDDIAKSLLGVTAAENAAKDAREVANKTKEGTAADKALKGERAGTVSKEEALKTVDAEIAELEAARDEVAAEGKKLAQDAQKDFKHNTDMGDINNPIDHITAFTSYYSGKAKAERASAKSKAAGDIQGKIDRLRNKRRVLSPVKNMDLADEEHLTNNADYQRLSEDEKIEILDERERRRAKKKEAEAARKSPAIIDDDVSLLSDKALGTRLATANKKERDLRAEATDRSGRINAGSSPKERAQLQEGVKATRKKLEEQQKKTAVLDRENATRRLAGKVDDLDDPTKSASFLPFEKKQAIRAAASKKRQRDEFIADQKAGATRDEIETNPALARFRTDRHTKGADQASGGMTRAERNEPESDFEKRMKAEVDQNERNRLAMENLGSQLDRAVTEGEKERDRLADVDKKIQDRDKEKRENQKFAFTSLEGFSQNIQQGLGSKDKLAMERNKILKKIDKNTATADEVEDRMADIVVDGA